MFFDLIRLRLSRLGQFFFYQHGSQVATKHDLRQCIYKFSLSKTEKQRKAARMSLFLLNAHQSHFSKERVLLFNRLRHAKAKSSDLLSLGQTIDWNIVIYADFKRPNLTKSQWNSATVHSSVIECNKSWG